MTDLSSNTEEIEAIADMAGELISTKIEMAKRDTQMTHVLRIGTFHMELFPDKDIDVEKIFSEMLNNLIQNFGEKLLEISVLQVKQDENGNDRRQYA